MSGKLFLIPSSAKLGEITRVLREGYDAQRLIHGLRRLVTELRLDMLLIDTHPGLNEETLLSLAISHALVIVMRPDQQDYEGTGITVKVAQSLQVPRMLLVVNQTPPAFDSEAVKAKVEQAYGCAVAAVLPHSDEMMNLASAGIFALRYPDHPVTNMYRQVAAQLTV
jgi:MinD-like ATPase involved in chromosome partitioning or flagellar assembly